ncbi:helix-turn-helix domain-containing protein [Glutamicibacter endophyticus]|uniref:helix-turn-helix domain-containing protein n=1 Tax=Glutamicibacter endophyticus TaxID=1522174 RepID=UPI003AF16681
MHREPLDGNISLAQLEAVIAIVDFGSFTAAADVLGISQPSLSRRISALAQIFHVAADGHRNPVPNDSRWPSSIPPTTKSA